MRKTSPATAFLSPRASCELVAEAIDKIPVFPGAVSWALVSSWRSKRGSGLPPFISASSRAARNQPRNAARPPAARRRAAATGLPPPDRAEDRPDPG